MQHLGFKSPVYWDDNHKCISRLCTDNLSLVLVRATFVKVVHRIKTHPRRCPCAALYLPVQFNVCLRIIHSTLVCPYIVLHFPALSGLSAVVYLPPTLSCLSVHSLFVPTLSDPFIPVHVLTEPAGSRHPGLATKQGPVLLLHADRLPSPPSAAHHRFMEKFNRPEQALRDGQTQPILGLG